MHDHTYHMIYLDQTTNLSFQQMFKQKHFLVETNSDFLFKKSQEICQCKYVHLEFFNRPTKPENETHVSYYFAPSTKHKMMMMMMIVVVVMVT